ncbi:hypothetical protein [Streptomyces sp. UG1]|uniref:hypothetical protein n=1 Tax=Streptomyces sp. UG1 TaxID=3417652 RepID=UPI003CE879D6
MPTYAAVAGWRALATGEDGADDPEAEALGVLVDTSRSLDGFASPGSDDMHPVAISTAVAP